MTHVRLGVSPSGCLWALRCFLSIAASNFTNTKNQEFKVIITTIRE
jgi:hypothetical protein